MLPRPALSVVICGGRDPARTGREPDSEVAPNAAYEVIAADPAASPVIALNRAAKRARGRWLLFCQDGIDPNDPWLERMMACAVSDLRIGAVTPRHVDGRGRLIAAGGLVQANGTVTGRGAGEDPDRFCFGFRCEVDYGETAALLVERNLWLAAGGFDERLRSPCYAAADLGFRVRESGLRVVYDPRATIVHPSGTPAGMPVGDNGPGGSEEDRRLLTGRWQHRLGPRAPDGVPALPSSVATNVLVIADRVPPVDGTLGSGRLRGMLVGLVALGHRVTLLPEDLHPAEPNTADLQDHGVEVIHGPIDLGGELARMAGSLRALIVIGSGPARRWSDAARRLAPQAQVLHDSPDLHWLAEARRLRTPGRGLGDAHGASITGAVAALREVDVALMRAADAILLPETDQARRLQRELPELPVTVTSTPGTAVHRLLGEDPGGHLSSAPASRAAAA